MGYTLTTPCKSHQALRRMMAFLEEHYRTWPQVLGESWEPSVRGPLTEDLSYDHGKCRIGFDFNAFGGERSHLFGVCRFMALRVGRLGRWEDFSEGAPYIVYDGCERFPVLDKTIWRNVPKEWTWAKCSPEGYKTDPYDPEKEDTRVMEELTRLSQLWDGWS